MTATQPKATSFEPLKTVDGGRRPSQIISSTEDKVTEGKVTEGKVTEHEVHECEIHECETHEHETYEHETIEEALSSLSVGDFHSRWDSAKQFIRRFQSDRPVPHLIRHLQNSTDPEHQWFLVRILGQYNQPIVVETLAQFLVTTPEAELQAEAIKSLTQLGDSAIVALARQLQSNHLSQRRLAARTLAQIRRTAVITPLLSIARDADSQLRLIAVEALGSFHDSRITPILISAVTDESAIALEAIRAIGRRSDLLKAHDLVDLLQRHLSDDSEPVAKESATALGRLGTEAAAVALGSFLTQPAPTAVKVAAVRALGWLDSAIAIAHLASAFECAPPIVMPAVKQEIAKALGQARLPANKSVAAKPLVKWLQQIHKAPLPSESFALKQTVISSLTWLGATDATESLIPLLADTDPRIQMHALSALKQIDPRSAGESVLKYLQTQVLSQFVEDKLTEHLSNW